MEIIHMTAVYSNAVLVAMLPQFSDFAKKLDLPVPLPITANQVVRSHISKSKDFIHGSVSLTNGYSFASDGYGYVGNFCSTNNIYAYLDPSDLDRVASFVRNINMTTNEAVEMGRNAVKKLGYKLEYFGAQSAPSDFQGPPGTKMGGVLPFCQIEWKSSTNEDDFNYVKIDVDMNRKELVGISVFLNPDFAKTNHLLNPLKVNVVPELESDYRKRTGSGMYVRTNAPPRPEVVIPKKLE